MRKITYRSVHARIRRAFHGLRTEGAGVGREAAAIGLGIFIGCLPLYGLHLAICWTTGWLLRLNRLKMYLAAHVSNPLFAPTLVFVEIQVGAWLRRGSMHELTLEAARTTNLAVFGLDAVVGSLIVGAGLGLGMAAATYAMSRAPDPGDAFQELVRETSDRYITTSVTAWEFARGKLRGDPVYRAIVRDPLLPSGGTILDVGCGQGLALALLADADKRFRTGTWPAGWNPPPRFEQRIGVEIRPRTAALARRALDRDATIVAADVRQWTAAPCDAVLFLDVLHMMPFEQQNEVLMAAIAALQPGGVILIREADASAGWRFQAVRVGNRLKALAFGAWRQRFHFRTADAWLAWLAARGLAAELRPMSSQAFANVLIRVTRPAA